MVRFDNVGMRYGSGPEILRDVSFILAPGSFHFLTGASGAVKSTLLRLMYLARRPTRGLISLFDRDIATLALTGARGGLEPAPSIIWFAVATPGGEIDLSGLAGRDVWARDEITQERLGGTAVQSGDPVLLAGR